MLPHRLQDMHAVDGRHRTKRGLVSSLFLALLGIAGWTAALVSVANPASASCAGPFSLERSLQDADLVFVGTVTQLTNGDRWASFAVEDLWKGELDSQHVEVRGGAADPGDGVISVSSVDRRYDTGARYLVFARDPTAHGFQPVWGTDGRFEDNNCSATQLYTDELEGLRPSDARRIAVDRPAATPDGTPNISRSFAPVGIVVAGGVVAIGLCAFGFTHRPRRTTPPSMT